MTNIQAMRAAVSGGGMLGKGSFFGDAAAPISGGKDSK